MTEEQERFENWWIRPIRELAANEHNGFAVLVLSIPLLERYLREKSRVGEGRLTVSFYTELGAILPELEAHRLLSFWHAYRNGLLHQATFSRMLNSGTAVPGSWIKPSQGEVVSFDEADDCFSVNARAFSERVLGCILSDFGMFAGASSPNHPLPVIELSSSDETPGARSGVRH